MASRLTTLLLKVDTSSLEDLVNALDELSAAQKDIVLPNTLNAIGARGFTVTKRTLADETGAAVNRVGQFLETRKAFPGRLAFRIQAKGEYLSLKDFKPSPSKMGKRTPGGGVRTKAWQRTKVYRGSFIGPGEHVYKRTKQMVVPRKGRWHGKADRAGKPIKRALIKKMWGPAVPAEMVRGKSMAAVRQIIDRDAPRLLESQVDRILKRVKVKHKL